MIVLGAIVSASAGAVHQLWAGQALTGLGAAALFPTSLAAIAAGTSHGKSRARGVASWSGALAVRGHGGAPARRTRGHLRLLAGRVHRPGDPRRSQCAAVAARDELERAARAIAGLGRPDHPRRCPVRPALRGHRRRQRRLVRPRSDRRLRRRGGVPRAVPAGRAPRQCPDAAPRAVPQPGLRGRCGRRPDRHVHLPRHRLLDQHPDERGPRAERAAHRRALPTAQRRHSIARPGDGARPAAPRPATAARRLPRADGDRRLLARRPAHQRFHDPLATRPVHPRRHRLRRCTSTRRSPRPL